jgi:hypothetical protein
MSLPSSTKKVSQLPAIPILMSWSGGKDCYLALNALRQDPQYEVVELVSSVCRETGCVGIHEVRRELIRQQERRTRLTNPLGKGTTPNGWRPG